MKCTFKKSLSVILASIIILSCFGVVCSAAGSDALTYIVKSDGTAGVKECSETAKGSVVIPAIVKIKGKSYDVTSIENNAFENCKDITTVSIAEGITSIGSKAFSNCTALTDVYMPESLVICQYTAFNGCETVTIHCYSSNYQLFTVYGINANLNIDILDSEGNGISGSGDSGITEAIVNLIKKIILAILSLFMTSGTQKSVA